MSRRRARGGGKAAAGAERRGRCGGGGGSPGRENGRGADSRKNIFFNRESLAAMSCFVGCLLG